MTAKSVMWVNVYREFRGNTGSAHTTRELADTWRKGRIACVKIEFEEGEGLLDANEQEQRKV